MAASVEDLERAVRRLQILTAIFGAAGVVTKVEKCLDALLGAWSSKGIPREASTKKKDAQTERDVQILKAANAFHHWAARLAGGFQLEELRKHIEIANEWADPPVPDLPELELEQLGERLERFAGQLEDLDGLPGRVEHLAGGLADLRALPGRVEKLEASQANGGAPNGGGAHP